MQKRILWADRESNPIFTAGKSLTSEQPIKSARLSFTWESCRLNSICLTHNNVPYSLANHPSNTRLYPYNRTPIFADDVQQLAYLHPSTPYNGDGDTFATTFGKDPLHTPISQWRFFGTSRIFSNPTANCKAVLRWVIMGITMAIPLSSAPCV